MVLIDALLHRVTWGFIKSIALHSQSQSWITESSETTEARLKLCS